MKMSSATQLLCSCFLPSVFCLSALAQGTAFTYQGRLNDGAGPASGTYDFTFALQADDNGAAPIGAGLTRLAVPVTNGLFTVLLDFTDPNSFTGASRWLEIGVRSNGSGAFTTLHPRQAFTAAPYAIRAANYSGPVDASQLASTVADARLSTNVALRAGGNAFTGNQSFNGNLGIGLATPAYLLDAQQDQAVGRFTTTDNPNGAVLGLRNIAASPTYLGAVNFEHAFGTPGQIGYLASDQMTFRVGDAERISLSATGLAVNAPLALNALGPPVTNGITGLLVNHSNGLVRLANAQALTLFAANACGTNNPGPTCASPEFMGSFSFGGQATRTGVLPAGGSAERWFRVSWLNSGASYNPRVYLSDGRVYYAIDVFLTCSGLGNLALGSPNWETQSQETLPPGTTVLVRVRLYTANPMCQPFILVFANG